MSMFNLKEVTEEVKGGAGENYIYPGVKNRVVISKWEHGVSSQKGTPFIGVYLVTEQGKSATPPVEPKRFEFYFTEKSTPDSLSRIKHIITKVATEQEWSSKEPADMEEMVDHLNDISRGKVLRIKFTGEQYENNNGEIKEAARIGYPEFAEAVEDGAEYPAIADEDTKLVYNPDNEYDLKRLNKTTDNVSNSTTVATAPEVDGW